MKRLLIAFALLLAGLGYASAQLLGGPGKLLNSNGGAVLGVVLLTGGTNLLTGGTNLLKE